MLDVRSRLRHGRGLLKHKGIMIIQGNGIQLDARVFASMELHESRSLVVIRYRKHRREDLGELRLQFRKEKHARSFFEKVREASLAKVREIRMKDFSVQVDPYEYEKYIEEELKVLKGDESYRFN